MRTPLILLVISLLGLGGALVWPASADLILLAGPAALASLFLLLREWLRGPSGGKPGKSKRWIVVDGSNVMHWKDGTADLGTLRAVLAHLRELGFSPGVMFDANAGYKLAGQYLHDGALGRQLGLPKDRVMVVPRGTPADPMILTAARDLNARIVTNDRYRDWIETYPEINNPGHLIRGGFRNGQLWLDLH